MRASDPAPLALAWSRLGRLLDRLAGVLVAASAVLLVLMVILMGAEIASRGLFRTSTQIADEYSGYFFTAMTLFCFFHAQRSDKFLRVDALRNRWPPRVRAAADAVASLLAAALAAVLVYATWSMTRASYDFNALSLQPSQTPLFLPQAVMPISLALLVIGFVHTGVTSLLQAVGRLPFPARTAPATATAK